MPDYAKFYPCEIHAHHPQQGDNAVVHVHSLNYEDKEVENPDLAGKWFWIVDEMKSSEEKGNNSGSEYKMAGGG